MRLMKIFNTSILGFVLTTANLSMSHAILGGYTAGELKIVNDSKNNVDVLIYQGTCAKLAVKKTDDDSKSFSRSFLSGLKSAANTPDCNKQKTQMLSGKYGQSGDMKRDSMTIAAGQWAVAFKQGNNPNAFIPAICLPDKNKKGNILLLQTPKIAGVPVGFKCKQVESEPSD